jgi:plasmid stability protein
VSENQKSSNREANKYIVRFPDGMREEIKRRAAENCRSMNAEIIYLLKRAMAECDEQAA